MTSLRNWPTRLTVLLLVCLPLLAQKDQPDSEDQKLFKTTCGNCHPVSMVTNRHYNREGWQQTIQVMIDKGLNAPDDDLVRILEYLVKNYGPDKPASATLNINTEPAAKIAAFFGIPEPEAASLVQYRETHGKFKDWSDVAKVRGVDATKLEPKKDRVVY